MPDSYILALGGTQVDVATVTRADPGADFGANDLLRARLIEGPHTEGALAHEETAIRRMSFPLLLRASHAAFGLGLEDQEALLRKLARPGATLDLKPHGATTAVRFDVLSGRYEFDYGVHHNREGIRLGRLELETKPYGYWPTMILLASVASVALPGAITWTGSIIGDAPALAKIVVQPTVASHPPAGTWPMDFLALSVSHRASHLSFLPAASILRLGGASLLGVALAPGSQAVRYAASQQQANWTRIGHYIVASALEPAYRGRYRAYSWFRLSPSQALPWYASLDVVAEPMASFAALGSYAPIATIVPQVASGAPGAYGPQPSPAFQLLDLGEITLPPVGTGLGGGEALRIWVAPPAGDVGVASPVLETAGLFLLPLDSDFAGVLPRGLAQPSISLASPARLTLDSEVGQAVLGGYNLNLATAAPWVNAWQHYRGVLPRLATGGRLDLLHGNRKTGVIEAAASYPQILGSYGPFAYYRMEETAGPTLIDSMGSWHASWSNFPTPQAGKIGTAAVFDGAADLGVIPSVLAALATSWSISMWLKHTGVGESDFLMRQGHGDEAVGSGLIVQIDSAGDFGFGFRNADMLTAAGAFEGETEYALWTLTWDYSSRVRNIWRNRELIASGAAGGTFVGSGPIFLGRDIDAAQAWYTGGVDELAFFRGTAIGSSIIANLHAYGNPVAAASGIHPAVHGSPAFASVSIAYRPRFQFMKGL